MVHILLDPEIRKKTIYLVRSKWCTLLSVNTDRKTTCALNRKQNIDLLGLPELELIRCGMISYASVQ